MLKQEFEYISRGPVNGPPRRLVVLLHGYGRDASLMEKMADELLRLVPDALVLMPHAPEPAERQTVPGGRQWFSLQGGPPEIKDGIKGAAAKLNAFIDNQRDMLGLKDSQVALMGFSQGAAVALYAALQRPQPMAGVVAHSTVFGDFDGPHSQPPALFLYGTADEAFSQARFAKTIEQLRTQFADLTVHEVSGLAHRTSAESRRIAAAYIRDRLAPG